MSDDFDSASDALGALQNEYADKLDGQRGQPSRGLCIACNKDIPAHELHLRCRKCKHKVCIRCADSHQCDGSAGTH
jgi:hypothetical protein